MWYIIALIVLDGHTAFMVNKLPLHSRYACEQTVLAMPELLEPDVLSVGCIKIDLSLPI